MSSATSVASSVAESILHSATAEPSESPTEGFSYGTVAVIATTGIVTTLAIIAASIYFSGYADDVAEWWAKRYYKAKAIAEVKVLENAGMDSVQGAVKGRLPARITAATYTDLDVIRFPKEESGHGRGRARTGIRWSGKGSSPRRPRWREFKAGRTGQVVIVASALPGQDHDSLGVMGLCLGYGYSSSSVLPKATLAPSVVYVIRPDDVQW
jgi:hypothetical protein